MSKLAAMYSFFFSESFYVLLTFFKTKLLFNLNKSSYKKVVGRPFVVLNLFQEKLFVMTGVPDPVRSGQNVLRDPPPDLDLALGQHEVGPVPDESVFNKINIGV